MEQGSLRRIRALIVKEFYQIIRDPSTFLIGIVMPLILIFLYAYGVSLDMNHLRIGLVMEDTAPDAQSFAKALTNSRYFDVTIVRDRRELHEPMLRGKIRGIVVIPSYFSAFLKRSPNVAPIQVIADGSEPNTASFVQNYVQAAWNTWMSEEAIAQGIEAAPVARVQPRFWYNEELESRNFLIPGSLAVIMTLTGTLLTALVVSREWERGTMEAMMATPVTIPELLIGKIIPYFLFAMGSMLMCVAISVWIYHVPFRGSLLLLGIVSGVFLISALGLGLLISTIARNQFVAAQVSQVTAFLPAFMLSGFIFEISSMPWIIQMISSFIPARYFVSSLQTLFLVGDVWALILFNLLPMLGVGLGFILVTGLITVKRLD